MGCLQSFRTYLVLVANKFWEEHVQPRLQQRREAGGAVSPKDTPYDRRYTRMYEAV